MNNLLKSVLHEVSVAAKEAPIIYFQPFIVFGQAIAKFLRLWI